MFMPQSGVAALYHVPRPVETRERYWPNTAESYLAFAKSLHYCLRAVLPVIMSCHAKPLLTTIPIRPHPRSCSDAGLSKLSYLIALATPSLVFNQYFMTP
jgi:hypothetical protein